MFLKPTNAKMFSGQSIKRRTAPADLFEIAQAHESGTDVSQLATVTYGKQVRFKNAPRKKRKTNEDES